MSAIPTAVGLADRRVVGIFFGSASEELMIELERIVHIVRAIDVDRPDFDARCIARKIAEALAERDPNRCLALLKGCPEACETLELTRLPGLADAGQCYLYDRIWQLAFDILQARAWGPLL